MADDVEPELTLAVDSMFPIPLLMESLKALRVAFPLLPATVFTEALGGSEQRLRDGAARLAIYTVAPTGPSDLAHRVHDPRIDVAGSRRRSSPRRAAGAADARGARAARPACAYRSNRADPELGRRDRWPSPLAIRRPGHPPRFPARGLRLVQHAEPHGRRPHRGRPAEEARGSPVARTKSRCRSTSSTSAAALLAAPAAG